MGQMWKLNPSDFAFLGEEDRRCYYWKVVKGFERPRALMPKINNLEETVWTGVVSSFRL